MTNQKKTISDITVVACSIVVVLIFTLGFYLGISYAKGRAFNFDNLHLASYQGIGYFWHFPSAYFDFLIYLVIGCFVILLFLLLIHFIKQRRYRKIGFQNLEKLTEWYEKGHINKNEYEKLKRKWFQ